MFERGQVWKNPDDELMLVLSVCGEREKIEYVTQDGQRGSFYASSKVIVDNIEQFHSPHADVAEELAKCLGEAFNLELEDGPCIFGYELANRINEALEKHRKVVGK